MPAEEKMATNISVRASIDGIIDILGENSAKIMLRDTGLSYLLENKPAYNFDPCLTIPEQAMIYSSIADLLGLSGALGVWRRIGYTVLKYAHLYGHALDALEELPPDEKFAGCMNLFVIASGKGRLVHRDDGAIDFDCYDCIHCKGYKQDRPMCSHYEGFIQYIADFAYGKNAYRAKETECKACGGETCYFRLEKTV
jgi:predicted hydrocarbon binding protein